MNSKLPEGIRARLLKIQKLAKSGVGGERDNAQAMFDALCEEHGVAPESLASNETKSVRFSFVDAREKSLLTQCIYFVLQKRGRMTYWASRKGMEIECTETEALDIRASFAHYRKLYAEEEQTFFDAFIQRHRIFGPGSDDAEPEPLDPIALERLINMMRGMKHQKSWQRPAARLTA